MAFGVQNLPPLYGQEDVSAVSAGHQTDPEIEGLMGFPPTPSVRADMSGSPSFDSYWDESWK